MRRLFGITASNPYGVGCTVLAGGWAKLALSVVAALAVAGCGAVPPDVPNPAPDVSDAGPDSEAPAVDPNEPTTGDLLAACTPESNSQFCSRLGKNCGAVRARDNCGHRRTVTCGTCTAPNVCGSGGTANVCGCTPLTAAQACTSGRNCGAVPNGCGGTVSCGICTAPNVCGSG